MKNKEEPKRLGWNIKGTRLLQAELAKRVGVLLRTIQRAESGDTKLE